MKIIIIFIVPLQGHVRGRADHLDRQKRLTFARETADTRVRRTYYVI